MRWVHPKSLRFRKRYTASSEGEVCVSTCMTWNRALRRAGEPRLEILRLADKSAGLEWWGLYTGKGHQGLLVGETAYIANLGHKLGSQRLTDISHGKHNRVFLEHVCQSLHFLLCSGESGRYVFELDVSIFFISMI